ncbi:MAG: hypothetical protein SPI25_03895 [Dialister sp.]|nr:hypothetical protein [Dialister sp.]
MNTMEEARRRVEAYQGNDVDKAGNPYREHLLRVSARGTTEEERLTGLLHDLPEDHGDDITEAELRRRFGDRITDALVALTFQKDCESREEYLRRVAANRLALAVKWNDLSDNSDPDRLSKIADRRIREKLAEKYTRDKEFLRQLALNEAAKL